jgi:Cell Wall Hydrolase
MRASLITAGLIAGALLSAPVQAAYLPDETVRFDYDPALASHDIVGETEHYCMTLALFFEGGSTGESEEGLRHIARVVVERAKAARRRWGGSTICGVVFKEAKGVCQFSFACLPLARRTPRGGKMWEVSAAVAEEALEGNHEGTDELIRYYMNAELASLRNVCMFRREFVPVVKAGRHEFFREATREERKELAKVEFEACTRYAAVLEAQKAKTKRAAAKKGNGKHKAVAKAGKARAKHQVAKAGTGKAKVTRTRLSRR